MPSTPTSTIGSAIAPVKPRNFVGMKMATNVPTMNTSPWAKLISSMMP